MHNPTGENPSAALAALRFYLDAGVDEAIDDIALDRTVAPPPQPLTQRLQPVAAQARAPLPAAGRPAVAVGGDIALAEAERLARAAPDLEALKAAIAGFEGSGLKATASNIVFADGNPDSQVMLVGEAPGREEDLKGLPFVGESGKLLDRMMGAIGRDRTGFYITNVLPWRPPGNRNPTQEEIALFLPFVRHHIALVRPKVLLLLGNISAKTLFDTTEGITRMRGKWREIAIADQVIPAMATYHPAFLLRQPGAKREAWRDLLSLEARLTELKI